MSPCSHGDSECCNGNGFLSVKEKVGEITVDRCAGGRGRGYRMMTQVEDADEADEETPLGGSQRSSEEAKAYSHCTHIHLPVVECRCGGHQI